MTKEHNEMSQGTGLATLSHVANLRAEREVADFLNRASITHGPEAERLNIPEQWRGMFYCAKEGLYVPLAPDRGAAPSLRAPVPASAFTDTTAVIDVDATVRPGISPTAYLNWISTWSRGAMSLGVVTSGFAHIQGRCDFPSGFRGRGAASRLVEELGTTSGLADSFDGPVLAGNTRVLPVVTSRPDGRIIGVEMSFGISTLNFAPYNLTITNDSTAVVAAQSPVPPLGRDRGVPLVRTLNLRVFTPTLTIFLPFGYREEEANDETAAVDIGDLQIIEPAGATAYFGAFMPAGAIISRGTSFFATSSSALSTAQITPAMKGSPAIMRVLRSMELSA